MMSLRYLTLCLCLFFWSPDTATATDRVPNEAFTVMEAAASAYLNNPYQSPGLISASTLHIDLDMFTVIDLRSENSYLNGHIPGAYHSSLGSLVEDLADRIPSDKPFVIAGYSGHTSGHAKIAMELLGYNNVYSLNFGMSSWNPALDMWSSQCSDYLVVAETENQNPNLSEHPYPELMESPETVVAERVSLMLESGYKGITYQSLEQNPEAYFIINYFGEADYMGSGSAGAPGHIPGAFQFAPYVSMGLTQMLENIPLDQPVVVYGWTGQSTSQVAAYLNMLGYNAYNLNFGANSLFYSSLFAHRWSPSAANNFELEYGAGSSAVPGIEPSVISQLGNHPNPFNPVTDISFRLSEPATVSLRVFDVSGRVVRDLVSSQTKSAGRHVFPWQGRDNSGQLLPSGTYLYRLDAGSFQESRRLMLVK